MKGIDTTILLAFLINSPPEDAKKCEELFIRVAKRKEKLYIPFVVVLRLVEELEKRLLEDKSEIIPVLRDLFSLKGVTFGSKKFLDKVMGIYQESDLCFLSSIIVASMQEKGVNHLYSYDGNSLSSYLSIFNP